MSEPLRISSIRSCAPNKRRESRPSGHPVATQNLENLVKNVKRAAVKAADADAGAAKEGASCDMGNNESGKHPRSSSAIRSPKRVTDMFSTLGEMTPHLKDRIDALLTQKGMTRRGASLAIGRNEHFLRDWLSGKVEEPGVAALSRLARLLGVSVDELTIRGGVSDEEPHPYAPAPPVVITRPLRVRTRGAPMTVRFTAQAGAWLEQDGDAQQAPRSGPLIAPNPNAFGDQWLELVEGDSIDKIAPPGSYLHVLEARGYYPRPGDVVIVSRTRADGGLRERSVKVVAIGARGEIELWPASTNPRWREPLKLTPEGASEDESVEVSIAGRVIGVYRTFNGGAR